MLNSKLILILPNKDEIENIGVRGVTGGCPIPISFTPNHPKFISHRKKENLTEKTESRQWSNNKWNSIEQLESIRNRAQTHGSSRRDWHFLLLCTPNQKRLQLLESDPFTQSNMQRRTPISSATQISKCRKGRKERRCEKAVKIVVKTGKNRSIGELQTIDRDFSLEEETLLRETLSICGNRQAPRSNNRFARDEKKECILIHL